MVFMMTATMTMTFHVMPYQLAYLSHVQVSLCPQCEARGVAGLGTLGPVQRGLHEGDCDSPTHVLAVEFSAMFRDPIPPHEGGGGMGDWMLIGGFGSKEEAYAALSRTRCRDGSQGQIVKASPTCSGGQQVVYRCRGRASGSGSSEWLADDEVRS
jgi:hypothetical protein